MPEAFEPGRDSKQEKLQAIVTSIRTILSIESPSTMEQNLRDVLQQKIESLGPQTRVDGKGNLWIEGEGKDKSILLNAHLDRVGSGTVRQEGTTLVGRLDDAVGISLILSLLQNGRRPSVVFTVEEESQKEINLGDEKRVIPRELPEDPYRSGEKLHQAGARHAADQELWSESNKPKLLITVDVTVLAKPKEGPIIYTSSGQWPQAALYKFEPDSEKFPHAVGNQFYFNSTTLKNLAAVLYKNGLRAHFVSGKANDSIEFSFVPDLSVVCIEVPVLNLHTDHEVVDEQDVMEVLQALEVILDNVESL